MRRSQLMMVVGMAMLSVCTARAQVGYDPPRSPYRDLRETQEITFYSGYYGARVDPARVAPKSGPIVGAHYQWRASGPATLTADLARVESERRVLDPERLATCAAGTDCKSAGMFRWPLYMADVGVALDLTGARSFFHLVPSARLGAGVVSDFHSKADVGEFGFGTRFALTWGGGIRWLSGGRYQVRADVINRLYSVAYPESYYRPADDGSVIFAGKQTKSAWLNNPALTIGVSYLFSR